MIQLHPRQPMRDSVKPVRVTPAVKYGRSATTSKVDSQTPTSQTSNPQTPVPLASMPPAHNVARQTVTVVPVVSPVTSKTALVASETEIARTPSDTPDGQQVDVPGERIMLENGQVNARAGRPKPTDDPLPPRDASSNTSASPTINNSPTVNNALPATSRLMSAQAERPASSGPFHSIAAAFERRKPIDAERRKPIDAERRKSIDAEYRKSIDAEYRKSIDAAQSKSTASGRSIAAHYEVWTHQAGILEEPGLFHWLLGTPGKTAHLPIIEGPVIALVGQYQMHRDPRFASLISVSFAANFNLRDPDSPFAVGVLFPQRSAPRQPNLAHLIGHVLGEAATSVTRFQAGGPGAASHAALTTASHDELTVMLHFRHPNGVPLRELFSPSLTRHPLPVRMKMRIPDMMHGAAANRPTFKVPIMLYDGMQYQRSHNLAETQFLLASHNPEPGYREMIGGSGLVADLEAGPAALLAADPDRYDKAAAQMARLLLCGHPSYAFRPLV